VAQGEELSLPEVIEADVGEGTKLVSIQLYYRFDEGPYVNIPMWPTSRPGIYAAEVSTQEVQSDRMQYYILAEEDSGDQLFKGSESVPLVKKLADKSKATESGATEAPLASSDTATNRSSLLSSDKRKYLYIALGVLAVGALAAAVSDDDDGGGSSNNGFCGGIRCDLPIVVP
jgi:hypothetical protein